MPTFMKILFAFFIGLTSQMLFAQPRLQVDQAWVRATVTGQTATGAFMRITSASEVRLIGVRSNAGIAQVHQMSVDQGVMRMSPVAEGLRLPAGQTVELKPGGYHIMLLDLKAALQPGQTVPLTLLLKDAKGHQASQDVALPVLSQAPHGNAGQAAPHAHKPH